MFSALAAVCTVDCAIEIVLITLHYIVHARRCRFASPQSALSLWLHNRVQLTVIADMLGLMSHLQGQHDLQPEVMRV